MISQMENLIGKQSIYSFEQRLLNITLIFGFVICLLCTIENYVLDIGFEVTAITIVGAVVSVYLYYLSTIKKSYKTALYSGLFMYVFIVIPVLWIFNAGTIGGTPYYLITLSSIIAILFKGKKKYSAMLLLLIITGALIVIEYKYPYIIYGYDTNLDRYSDISVGLIMNIFSNVFLFTFIIKQYNQEQKRVGEYLAEIEKQNLEIQYKDNLTVINRRLQQEIDERKRMELEIIRLDRLNLIGEMAAGLGHEIRNPMTTVRGFLQVLSKSDTSKQEYFAIMIDELDRANSIISEFLSLAKNKQVNFSKKNLNQIIKTLLPLIKVDALSKGNLVHMNAGEIPEFLLDEGEVRQLILNLVRNGLEAMSTGGDLTISTVFDCEEVVLSVKDEGTGMQADVLEKIGTPFFTTKDNGTGLGLAVCYSIVARHNARLHIETGPNGTTVLTRFTLQN